MSGVLPFKAIHYNMDKVDDISKVLAPPYDVIDSAYQDKLYERDPVNIIRLILARSDGAQGTDAQDSRYQNAARDYKTWTADSTLVRDKEPAIYYYTQEYKVGGTRFTRKGFIAAKELEEFGKGNVYPHEKTLSGPKKDRLNLIRVIEANLSCIFAIYSDSDLDEGQRPLYILKQSVKGTNPFIEATDDDGVISRLWIVTDKTVTDQITTAMEGRAVFIADGHHRYETALNYRNLKREETGAPSGPYDYIMMYFSSMDDEGMNILPTHRAIHSLALFNSDCFLRDLKEYFYIDDFFYTDDTEELVKNRFIDKLDKSETVSNKNENSRISFGLYMKDKKSYYILTLKDPSHLDDLLGGDLPQVYKSLDVTILHSLILEKILKISKSDQEKKTNIRYIKDLDTAIDEVRENDSHMVFIMNPTRIDQVKAVAEAGLVMPQKSTYFYPKLLTGLTINPLSNV